MTAIANVSLTNTFDEWRTITNQLVFLANEVEANGNLVRVQSNTSAIRVTANIGRGDTIYITANVSYNIADQARANLASANVVNAVHNVLTVAFAQANTSYDHANAAFFQANQAFLEANTAETWAVAAFNRGNNVFIHANSSYDQANQAFSQANAANVLAFNSAAGANAWVNTVYGFTNTYTRAVGTAGNTYAEATAAGANAYARTVGTAGNTYAEATAAGANAYAQVVGTAGNTYAVVIGASSNAWTNTIFGLSNAYAQAVGTAANNYAEATAAGANAYSRTVGTAGNNYSITIGVASNAWTNTVFGLSNVYARDVGTAGNTYTRTVGTAGNTYAQTVGAASNLLVGAAFFQANQGFFTANTANTRAEDAHTRIDTLILTSNSNTAIVTELAGAGFAKANAANVLAFNTGAGANAWTNTVYGLSNSYTRTVGTAGNTYAETVAAGANSWANTIGINANAWANVIGVNANAYANVIGTRSNNFALSLSTQFNAINTYVSSTGTAVNAYANVVGQRSNNYALSIVGPAFDKANAANVLGYNALPNTSGAVFDGQLRIPELFAGNTRANIARLRFVEASNVSYIQSGTDVQLSGRPIRFTPIGSITSTMTVDVANGYVGINSTTPEVALDVNGISTESFIGTGSVSGNVLNVTAVTSGTLSVGDYITFDSLNLKYGAYIRTFSTGSGGIGNYFLSESATVGSSTFRSTNLKDKTVRIKKSDTVIQTGEPIGMIQFSSTDASIDTKDEVRAFAGAQSTSTDGSVEFVIGTASGANSATERLRITKDGALSFNGSAVGAAGTILRSQGASLPLIYDTDAAFDRANAANVLAFTSGNEARGAFSQANQAFAKANSTSFTSNVVISVADSTNAALRITQTGTGVALLVEDSTPDSTPTVITDAGRIVTGSDTAYSVDNTYGGQITPRIQTHGTVTESAALAATLWTTSGAGSQAVLSKSRSGTIGTNTIVQNNDDLGAIVFDGDDGSLFTVAASIVGSVDGTPGANNMPGRLVFSTTANGASVPTERMRITANGNIGIGTTSPSANLHVVGNAIISTALTVGTINVAPAIGAAFDRANAANVLAFTSGNEAQGAFLRSNVAWLHANAAFFQANQAFADANTAEAWAAGAFLRGNVAFFQANQAFAVANTSGDEAEGAFLRGNVAWFHANAAFFQANQAFFKANTIGTLGTQASSSVSITGGTITGVTIDATSVDGISIGTLTAAGGIAYAFNTTQLRAIGAGTTDQVLTSQGSSAPTWQDVATLYGETVGNYAVGSYVLGYVRGTGIINNTDVAGSSIEPAGIWADGTGTDDQKVGAGFAADVASSVGYTKGGAALSGTWRVMGRVNNDNGSTYSRITLFLRTA